MLLLNKHTYSVLHDFTTGLILMRSSRTIRNNDCSLDISAYERSAVALKRSLNFGLQFRVNGRGHLVSRVLSDSGAANCYHKIMRPMMLLPPTFSSWWYVCTRVHACVGSLACFSPGVWCVLPRKSRE